MSYRFGKHAKANDPKYRTLQLADYLDTTLPPPPPSSANLARVYKALGVSDATVAFPMDGNDVKGDCTCAALSHAKTAFNAFVGRNAIPTTADTLGLYNATGRGDTGRNMLSVLKYIRKHGWLGEKPIWAFAEVNPKHQVQMQQAINLFGGLYTGFQVPENCIQEFDAHQPWTPGPLTQEGHAVWLIDYYPGFYIPLTWGNSTTATNAWEAECVDETYVILPEEAQEPGFMPGLDYQHLLADLKLVTK